MRSIYFSLLLLLSTQAFGMLRQLARVGPPSKQLARGMLYSSFQNRPPKRNLKALTALHARGFATDNKESKQPQKDYKPMYLQMLQKQVLRSMNKNDEQEQEQGRYKHMYLRLLQETKIKLIDNKDEQQEHYKQMYLQLLKEIHIFDKEKLKVTHNSLTGSFVSGTLFSMPIWGLLGAIVESPEVFTLGIGGTTAVATCTCLHLNLKRKIMYKRELDDLETELKKNLDD